jgi:threonine/homoserine/homoserine lactone efflux protein
MARALALGFLVGLPIAASPGPIFFLTLRRTPSRGWRSGLASGLGVASGDAVYAALAAFGVAAITNVLLGQRRWLGLAGGTVIGLIGLRTIFARQSAHPDSLAEGQGTERRELVGAYSAMVLLTLGNPLTIISFTAVFAGLRIHVASGWGPAAALVAGVLLGSAAWWIMMTGAASLVRERLTPAVTRGIGILCGFLLAGFGVFAVASSLH